MYFANPEARRGRFSQATPMREGCTMAARKDRCGAERQELDNIDSDISGAEAALDDPGLTPAQRREVRKQLSRLETKRSRALVKLFNCLEARPGAKRATAKKKGGPKKKPTRRSRVT
jgi:hypothetical protein